jgi:hypothetical protein
MELDYKGRRLFRGEDGEQPLDEQRYEEAMRLIRVGRTRTLVCMLAALPAAVVTGWVSGSEGAMIVALGLFGVAMVKSAMDLATVGCPRCNNLAFVGRRHSNILSSRCLHCGLAL